MNSKQLNRLLNLIRETGDRLVIADNESNEVFVLMPLEDYEKMTGLSNDWDEEAADFAKDENKSDFGYVEPENDLIGQLSEQELLEKINSEIAQWRSLQKKKADETLDDEIDEEKPKVSQKKDIGMTALGEVLLDKKYINGDFEETERQHPNLGPEEDLRDVLEEQPTEEKFYLEPVE